MPRKPRIDFPGAWHHVMHRGARRVPIFRNDADCQFFLDHVDDVVRRFELEVHAYALMPNHYHLLVRSTHGNLSTAIQRLNADFVQGMNLRANWDGPMFRGRFRSQLVRDESHLPYLMAYIHLNPLKAGLITKLVSHGWTSHRAYLGRDATEWLTTEYFAQVFDDPDELNRYVLGLHRGKEGWPEEMNKLNGWMRNESVSDKELIAPEEASRFIEPKVVLEKISKITGSDNKQLRTSVRGPRANPARRFAVWAFRNSTQLTQREIGDVLNMSAGQVAHVLRRIAPPSEQISGWIEQW